MGQHACTKFFAASVSLPLDVSPIYSDFLSKRGPMFMQKTKEEDPCLILHILPAVGTNAVRCTEGTSGTLFWTHAATTFEFSERATHGPLHIRRNTQEATLRQYGRGVKTDALTGTMQSGLARWMSMELVTNLSRYVIVWASEVAPSCSTWTMIPRMNPVMGNLLFIAAIMMKRKRRKRRS